MSASSTALPVEAQAAIEAESDPRRSLSLDIIVEDERWGALPAIADEIRRAGDALASHVAIGTAEAAIALSSDARVRELNRAYRGKDKPTNVLSFPALSQAASPAPPDTHTELGFLGDVILAFETVSQEAAAENKPLDQHVVHLVVHGVLHLLGYDHETDAEAGEMERLEVEILSRLEIPDPYVETD